MRPMTTRVAGALLVSFIALFQCDDALREASAAPEDASPAIIAAALIKG